MSVRVTWRGESPARKEKVDRELARLTSALVAMGASRVILFGSRARGEAAEWSDTDLLAIGPWDAEKPYMARLLDLHRRLAPGIAIDLLAYTPEELSKMVSTSTVVRRALAEGKVLHDGA